MAQCLITEGDGLCHRQRTRQVENGADDRGDRDPADKNDVGHVEWRPVGMNETPSLAVTAPAAGDVHVRNGIRPDWQSVQDGR